MSEIEVCHMDFKNSVWIYLVVGIIFSYVLMQSIFFLVRAYKKAIESGFTKEDLKKTILSSAVFTLAPSFAILIGLVTLTNIFGSMLAGMRLGTLGALTYELPTAELVIRTLQGFTPQPTEVRMITTALWVMTFGCIPPLLIIPLFFKKYNNKLQDIKKKDNTWNQVMMDALFIGMISAFVGFVVAPRELEINGELVTRISLLSILVFLTSSVLIIIFGVLIKKFKWEWLKNYALPLSMIFSMAMALVYFQMGVR
jgi:hypothetical protein